MVHRDKRTTNSPRTSGFSSYGAPQEGSLRKKEAESYRSMRQPWMPSRRYWVTGSFLVTEPGVWKSFSQKRANSILPQVLGLRKRFGHKLTNMFAVSEDHQDTSCIVSLLCTLGECDLILELEKCPTRHWRSVLPLHACTVPKGV